MCALRKRDFDERLQPNIMGFNLIEVNEFLGGEHMVAGEIADFALLLSSLSSHFSISHTLRFTAAFIFHFLEALIDES